MPRKLRKRMPDAETHTRTRCLTCLAGSREATPPAGKGGEAREGLCGTAARLFAAAHAAPSREGAQARARRDEVQREEATRAERAETMHKMTAYPIHIMLLWLPVLSVVPAGASPLAYTITAATAVTWLILKGNESGLLWLPPDFLGNALIPGRVMLGGLSAAAAAICLHTSQAPEGIVADVDSARAAAGLEQHDILQHMLVIFTTTAAFVLAKNDLSRANPITAQLVGPWASLPKLGVAAEPEAHLPLLSFMAAGASVGCVAGSITARYDGAWAALPVCGDHMR